MRTIPYPCTEVRVIAVKGHGYLLVRCVNDEPVIHVCFMRSRKLNEQEGASVVRLFLPSERAPVRKVRENFLG